MRNLKKAICLVLVIATILALGAIVIASSPYGAAWPYRFEYHMNVNCYGYVTRFNNASDPGEQYYETDLNHFGKSVDEIAEYVKKDFQRLYKTARIITSSTSPVNDDEYRIALRVGKHKLGGKTRWDYHFLLQCSDGQWCHKPGSQVSEKLGNINPSTFRWDMPYFITKSDGSKELVYYEGFYDSKTIYMALPKIN
ncbi:hypothetical protein PV797_21025 [Clostridiaceae bacterium M8S5]|nr:hypothetical protein PV797_21025 [Clostridiaceae bacterium M8S5]